jgi:hypothetical protein
MSVVQACAEAQAIIDRARSLFAAMPEATTGQVDELVHAPALDRKRAIQEAERRRRSGQASRIIFETARIRNPELAR